MAAFQRGFLTFHAIFAVWETRRCIRAQPKPSAPEGRGAVPDGLGTALHGGGSGRRPLRDPAGRFSGRSLRRSDTHGLHNVSTAHRQRLHRHRLLLLGMALPALRPQPGLRPRRHEPPPRSGVGTHPTAPSPARHGGRRAGDGRRRPDGADTRAACALRPHGNGTRAGRIGASRGDGFPLRQSAAGSPRAAAPRPSPAQCGGHRRHLALRRGGRAVARHDPRRRDVHGPGNWRWPRRRATQASTSSPRRPSGCCCGGRPISSTSGSSCRSSPWRRSSYGVSRSTGGCARRGGRRTPRWECSSSARSPRRRRRPLVSYCFGQIPLVGLAVNPPVILLTYGVVGVSLLWLAIPWPPLSVVVRPLLEGLAVAAKPAGRRSGRPALCRDRLPDDGGADRRGLSLFRNFHPRALPSVAEKNR